jgi:hypothetical protein
VKYYYFLKLKHLGLRDTAVTDTGIKHLTKYLSKSSISVDRKSPTNASPT